MGLMGKLFGGGTELSVTLNSSNVIAGGVVAGKVTVTGGKKPLTMTNVVVHVYFVNVKSGDGALPEIDMRKLSEQTVAVNVPLPAGKQVPFEFQVQLPEGLDPAGQYKLVATADIPSVKDPKADADFKVITPGHKARGAVASALFGNSEQDLLARYPGLLDEDESEQFSALCELRGDTYGEDAKKLVALAPWLLRFAKTGPVDLRDEALETWAALMNNRARPSDIQELEAFAADPTLTSDLRRAVVTAATKFADEGAAPLLARLAKDSDPDVREQVARSLHFEADDGLPGRLELIVALTQDADVSVRRSAAAALGAFSENPQAMKLAVDIAGRDPSPDVRAEALEALAMSHYSGMLDLVLSTYEQHVKSPMLEVRKAIAGRVSMLPPDARVGSIVSALLADPHAEVRKKMAWYGINMADHPDLEPLFRRVAETDPDDEVRSEAVYGMRGFLPPADAVAYARQRLAADATEKMCWTAINVAQSFDDERDAKALLQDVTKSNYANAASHARDVLRAM